MMHRRPLGLLLFASLLLPIATAAAGLFPDVSDHHLFKGEIESLARAAILKGNPDGKFYPDRPVNRAEFLKMLYTATNRKPKPINAQCFTDVEAGSWYEAFVCDASARENNFVQGYSDHTFRPASPVSRTEALKMVFMLLDLHAPDISQNDKDVIKFVDISTSAWYSKYVSAAYVNGMLPITGQSEVRFYPDKPLLRGEAATYIFNGQRALAKQSITQQASSAAASAAASNISSPLSSSPPSPSPSSSSAPASPTKAVSFPFSDSDRFTARKPTAYLFTLTAQTELSAQVSITGFYPADVTCRLYLLSDDGFSDEYYLGYQEKGICTIKVQARPGKYQLQLQPTLENVAYLVTAKKTEGDGNDGFLEAIKLNSGQSRTDVLGAADLSDWYTFTIDKEQTALVEVAAGEKLSCIIYTPSSVDQFGFTGPECGKPYLFRPGEDTAAQYFIGVGRSTGDTVHKVTYTVKFQKQ